MTFQKLLSNIRSGEMFGYFKCDIRVPDNLREKFEAFPLISKNTLVFRSDLADFIIDNAERNKMLTQTRKMPISSFQLINGTTIKRFYIFILISDSIAPKYTASFLILY